MATSGGSGAGGRGRTPTRKGLTRPIDEGGLPKKSGDEALRVGRGLTRSLDPDDVGPPVESFEAYLAPKEQPAEEDELGFHDAPTVAIDPPAAPATSAAATSTPIPAAVPTVRKGTIPAPGDWDDEIDGKAKTRSLDLVPTDGEHGTRPLSELETREAARLTPAQAEASLLERLRDGRCESALQVARELGDETRDALHDRLGYLRFLCHLAEARHLADGVDPRRLPSGWRRHFNALFDLIENIDPLPPEG